MKKHAAEKMWVEFCCFLLVGLFLMACQNGGNSNSTASAQGGDDAANAELCKKIEACGCEKFTQCMQSLASSADVKKPGVRECMMNSTCPSLCAGHPDACFGDSTGSGQGAGTAPPKTSCTNIPCSKSSDCPVGCSGGCELGHCLSF
jgi:hypothetical protein